MTTGRANSRRRRHGFTLLELVLVMLIICTLLGAAAPSLRGFFVSRQTDHAAVRVIALTRLARSMAVSEGRVYRLYLDDGRRTLYLAAAQEGGFERPRTGLARAWRLPDEVDLELEVYGAPAGRGHLDFLPDGLAEPSAIRLTDIKGGVVEVRCAAPTEPFAITSPEDDE